MIATSASFTKDAIAKSWKEALATWDVSTTLSPPQPYESGESQSHWQHDEPLAFIDLETRQVVVNLKLLSDIGAAASLTAVLAHEIGHHVKFPHTLGEAAVLQALEKRLIPGLKTSLTNLFYDLLVNEYVGRTRASELGDVYKGFVKRAESKTDPLFFFYLAIYEELWGLDSGELAPQGMIASMDKKHPGWRADARMFVQTFYALPDVHLQFIYFCSQFIRYIPDPEKFSYSIPMASDVPSPDADDLDAVIRGNAADQVQDALDEAHERGWIRDAGLLEEKETDPLTTIRRITNHMPGHLQVAFRQALVSKHYKRLVDQYILKIPGEPRPMEPFLPSVPEEWEWGDSPKSIDWTATVIAQGPLAGVKPLRRDLLPDEPPPREQEFPSVEIYLDTSGSMPDPSSALNTMTLAAQILAASAIRKKGSVRGIVYSSGPPLVSDWMRDEETARRFLLSYAGGGTDYPFVLLKRLAKERSDVIRVIISDSDFLWNAKGAEAMDRLKFGIEHSRLLVAFLAVQESQAKQDLKAVVGHKKFRLAIVTSLDGFAKAAAGLADAILPE